MSPAEPKAAKASLHLDENVVEAVAFVRGIRAFVGLVQEVSEFFERGLSWGITVREGSNIVDLHSTGGPRNVLAAIECLKSVESGLEVLEDRPELPVSFSTSAVQRAKRLADVVQAVGGHVQGPTKICRLTSQASAHADKLLGTPYTAIGSIEGELLLVSDVRGPQIGIREFISGRIVHCGFKSEDLDELATQFHQRISVRGVMKYRADGSIAKIYVEDHRVLRHSDQLPSADDVLGILREH